MGEIGEKEAFDAHALADAVRLMNVGRRTKDALTIQAAKQKAIRWAAQAGKNITDPEIAELLGLGTMDRPVDKDED